MTIDETLKEIFQGIDIEFSDVEAYSDEANELNTCRKALKNYISYHLVEMLDLCVKNHVIGTSEFILSKGKQYIKELK